MSPREAFGPNLRRLRIQRGISLHQIAAETKVSADLWDGLEHNNFDRWPGGIFARAYVREYARLIGADPESTVDDFCRWFPQGDRRVLRVVREQAEIVGHRLEWREQLPPDAGETDRREAESMAAARKRQTQPSLVNLFLRLRRTLGKA
ncbi:MAG: hypothetical protein DMF91_16875 [Acidobacteria bacterium]|jgi:transcriptional regulator with XRE-family HTH domain|nr:MAG: hypothetical protein DMF91_16875 [Acidobacteriota bacterium]